MMLRSLSTTCGGHLNAPNRWADQQCVGPATAHRAPVQIIKHGYAWRDTDMQDRLLEAGQCIATRRRRRT